MGLKSRKTDHRYARLRPIPMRTVLSPDPEVLESHPAFVDEVLRTAKTMRELLGLQGMDESWPLFKELREILPTTLAVGWPNFADRPGNEIEALEAAVQEPLAGGWIIGELENKSGFAKTGRSDSHFWSALAVLQKNMANDFSEQLAVEQSFSMTSAYYVSRIGKNGMRAVIAESVKPRPHL